MSMASWETPWSSQVNFQYDPDVRRIGVRANPSWAYPGKRGSDCDLM